MNQNNFKFAPSTTKCVLIELQLLYHFYLYLPYLLMVIDIPARKSRMLEASDVRSQRDCVRRLIVFPMGPCACTWICLPLYPRIENNSRNCKEAVKRWRRRESADGGRGESKNELPLDVSGFRHNTDPLLTPLLKHVVPPGTPAHGTPEHSGTPQKTRNTS